MRLSRLRLNGFKSFADPTEFVIRPGLTGIVGPNGCGKSNLLEALRWVMGETRPSQMRGGGMEDVIFAGTARRAARPFAEVALVFERDGAETELVRRIARDGGSAYRLGGREARLRDIQAMFADAASGAQSPSLVRQGQIAELIAARPAARRRVIEEAAGIAGLQSRRAEAAQRLGAAEANLARAAGAVADLETRLRALDRQARAAARHRELSDSLRRAEGMLMWRLWAAADEAQASAKGETRTLGALAERAAAAARAARATREAAEAGLEPLRAARAAAAEETARLRAELASLAEGERAAAARLGAVRQALADLARDEAREAELGRDAAASLRRIAAERQALLAEDEGAACRLAAAERETARLETRLREAEEARLRLAEAAARAEAGAEAARRGIEEARRDRDRAGAGMARAASARAEAEAALARAAAQGAAAAATAAAAEQARGAAETALRAAEAALPPLRQTEAEARSAAAATAADAAACAAELRALEGLVAADGPRRGAGAALSVPDGLEEAAAAALEDAAREPLAAEGDAAGEGWHVLPPFDPPPRLPAGAVPLAERIGAPPALARRLALTGLVPPEAAPRLWRHLGPGQALVTPDGALWRWDGLRRRPGGAAAAEAEALRRAARLEPCREAARRAGQRAQDARAAEADAARCLRAAETRLAEARQELGRLERQAAEGLRAAARAEADRALAQARREAAEAAEAEAALALAEATARLAEAEERAAALPDPAAARQAAREATAALSAAQAAFGSARAAEDRLRRAADGRRRRLAELAREAEGWETRRQVAADRAGDLAARRRAAEAALAAAEAEPAGLRERRHAAEHAAEAAAAAARDAAEVLRAAEADLRDAAQAEREADRRAAEAREALARAEALRLAAAGSAAEALRRLGETTGLGPAALLDRLGGDAGAIPPAEALRATIDDLRRRRDALGAVNLRAEEDARALAAEHEALMRERADCEAAVAELRRALSALNREGRERMRAAFERVDAEFARLFRHLFGGGEARLALVEGDDPLEAGVEIMARPPGKTLGTLSLLSGGEQTLTALALIFAVFLVAPAPVCVLDEVDAPLDDANVGRFCDLLDAMARETETRFLVITHHAVTMARMDRLFGVTMAERGVSQLVSVDLRAAEAMVA